MIRQVLDRPEREAITCRGRPWNDAMRSAADQLDESHRSRPQAEIQISGRGRPGHAGSPRDRLREHRPPPRIGAISSIRIGPNSVVHVARRQHRAEEDHHSVQAGSGMLVRDRALRRTSFRTRRDRSSTRAGARRSDDRRGRWNPSARDHHRVDSRRSRHRCGCARSGPRRRFEVGWVTRTRPRARAAGERQTASRLDEQRSRAAACGSDPGQLAHPAGELLGRST